MIELLNALITSIAKRHIWTVAERKLYNKLVRQLRGV
jgi:hypothetical protein